MELSIFPFIEIFLSFTFMMFLYFKYIKRGDNSKIYFFLMSISLFSVYFLGTIRFFITDPFFNMLLLKLSYISFLAIIVSMSSGFAYIMNFSKYFKHFLIIFSIFFLIGVFTSNNCYLSNEMIKCEFSSVMIYSFISGIIILIVTILTFFIYGIKKNNVHAILFSIGSFILISAVVLNILIKNEIYKIMSVPGIFFLIYSFLVKKNRAK